jgi:hypothetical protein
MCGQPFSWATYRNGKGVLHHDFPFVRSLSTMRFSGPVAVQEADLLPAWSLSGTSAVADLLEHGNWCTAAVLACTSPTPQDLGTNNSRPSPRPPSTAALPVDTEPPTVPEGYSTDTEAEDEDDFFFMDGPPLGTSDDEGRL